MQKKVSVGALPSVASGRQLSRCEVNNKSVSKLEGVRPRDKLLLDRERASDAYANPGSASTLAKSMTPVQGAQSVKDLRKSIVVESNEQGLSVGKR